MNRYFLRFAYDGTNYHGWQRQPNAISVQEVLEHALSTILRMPISVVGAGRTDTGVHAREMYAHLDLTAKPDCAQIVYKLNRMLPPDITVHDMYPVSEEMHARFSAVSRTYHYYVYQGKDPFARHYALRLMSDLDFDAMNMAASHLLSVRDFGAFCKSHTDVLTTICRVSEARWIEQSPQHWYFRITADRFLRNMVRAVVGTLFDVGRHKITIDDFDAIVSNGCRCEAGESVPGNALFLESVKY